MLTCEDPIFWLSADLDAGQHVEFTVGMPALERFWDTRIDMTVIGPGLENQIARAPGTVQQAWRETMSGDGALVFQSPANQSTCAHVESEEMQGESAIQDGRCHFWERFGDSHNWVLMDTSFDAVEAGTYKFALYTTGLNSAKMWFACCDWPEDFATMYDYPESECAYCGTQASNTAWASHYYESRSMAPYAGFPPYQEYCTPGAEPAEPDPETQCPPEGDTGDTGGDSGANCEMGCVGGVCHSHNIFGECNYQVYWINPAPTLAGGEVHTMQIYTGEAITFSSAGHQMAHNLFQMPGEAETSSCSFGEANEVGNVEDVRIGHTIHYETPGTYYYACGIGCTPTMQSYCHCAMGQRLIVEVADASEGMDCHEHAVAAQPLACSDGDVNAYMLENPDYGAAPGECSETCMQGFLVGLIGFTQGRCADEGYTMLVVESTEVRPEGSPMPMTVRIMAMPTRRLEYRHALQRQTVRGRRLLTTCTDGQVNAYIIGNSDWGLEPDHCGEFCTSPFVLQRMEGASEGSCLDKGFPVPDGDIEVMPPGSPTSIDLDIYHLDSGGTACHCHSYEEILCGPDGDPLYDEHIREIENECTGVLEGSETTCPFLCFQPFEVLHLHYIECGYRTKDATYLAVAATGMCHVGASLPFGAPCTPVAIDSPAPAPAPGGGFCVTIRQSLAEQLRARPCPM
jgi:hypothetical protein